MGHTLPTAKTNWVSVCVWGKHMREQRNVSREDKKERMSLNMRCTPLTEQNVPELSKQRKTLMPGEYETRE